MSRSPEPLAPWVPRCSSASSSGGFRSATLTPLASARSAGKTLKFKGEDVEVKELTPDSFEGVDIALFSAGGGISLEFAKHAVAAGAVVIDNSSAFRMDEAVPLVVPEINPEAARAHQGIIANPNCTTIVTLMGLAPLHREWGVKNVIASSYQAVSGSGAQGIIELESQVARDRGGRAGRAERLPEPDRVQRDPAGRCLHRQRLHQGGDEDGERGAQDLGCPRVPGIGDLRAGAGLPLAFDRGDRAV